ncbi:uncharacterized protein isoform X2 [Leptinotarsa decemlineata]|uniref:uncharacterized protein isoform X2 n=1 Tax=Leptinotarsa decemlineata TaxID=7539 RepID=UPI003D30A0C7
MNRDMSQSGNCFINKDYFIVEFPDEQANGQTPMAVVPYTWLTIDIVNHVRCLWPQNMKSNVEMAKAVENKIVLNSKDSQCRLCEVNIKFKTNDYEKAISRLKLLENESSISSAHSSEEDGLGKRKTKRNSRYDSSESEWGNPKYTSDRQKQSLSCPSKSPSTISSDDEHNIPSVPKLNLHRTNIDITPSTSNLKRSSLQEAFELTSEPVYTFKNIYDSVRRIETLVRQVSTKVEVLTKDVHYLSQIVHTSKESDPMENDDVLLQKMPLSSQEQLIEFDTELKNDLTFSEICSSLSVVGGRDGFDTVRRLLSKLISHDLALNMNWSGRNQKLSFKEYENTLKMILW